MGTARTAGRMSSEQLKGFLVLGHSLYLLGSSIHSVGRKLQLLYSEAVVVDAFHRSGDVISNIPMTNAIGMLAPVSSSPSNAFQTFQPLRLQLFTG